MCVCLCSVLVDTSKQFSKVLVQCRKVPDHLYFQYLHQYLILSGFLGELQGIYNDNHNLAFRKSKRGWLNSFRLQTPLHTSTRMHTHTVIIKYTHSQLYIDPFKKHLEDSGLWPSFALGNIICSLVQQGNSWVRGQCTAVSLKPFRWVRNTWGANDTGTCRVLSVCLVNFYNKVIWRK